MTALHNILNILKYFEIYCLYKFCMFIFIAIYRSLNCLFAYDEFKYNYYLFFNSLAINSSSKKKI